MQNVKDRCVAFFLVTSTLTFSFNSWAFPVKFGVSPDNSQDLLTQTVQSAKTEIILNVYEFDNPIIAQAIIEKIQAGLTVRFLLEGSPIPKISEKEKKTISEVVDAMRSAGNAGDHLFVMKNYDGNKSGSKKRRFKYDHAKYIVVDGQTVLVTSENYTSTGHPIPGKVGNRGWEVVMENSEMAQQLTQIFQSDTDTSFGDVEDALLSRFQTPGTNGGPNSSDEDRAKIRHVPALALGSGNANSAVLVTSPDSEAGIVQFIDSTNESLDIEQMSYPLDWKELSSQPLTSSRLNPAMAALIEAARRGVTVRVLLNDDNSFAHGKPDNPDGDLSDSSAGKQTNKKTVDYLNQLASSEGLKLESRIVNIAAVEITYIHNKGMIADGHRAFISSINGTQNSVMNNREVAISLDSTDGAAYYKTAFDFDWKQSEGGRGEIPGFNVLFQAFQNLVSTL